MRKPKAYQPNDKETYDAFRRELGELFRLHGRKPLPTYRSYLLQEPSKGKPVKLLSKKSSEARFDHVLTFFNDLWRQGKKISSPRNIGQRHIQAACQAWYAEGKYRSTVRIRLSALKALCEWLDKPGLVRDLEHYLPGVDWPDEREEVKVVFDVDVADLIRRADVMDARFGLMLRVGLGFNITPVELLDDFRPWKSDGGNRITLFRRRLIPIETASQRVILDMVKAAIPVGESLAWRWTRRGKDATPAYCESRYATLAHQLGLNKALGEYLRQHCVEVAEQIAQVVPPKLSRSSWCAPANDFPVYGTSPHLGDSNGLEKANT